MKLKSLITVAALGAVLAGCNETTDTAKAPPESKMAATNSEASSAPEVAPVALDTQERRYSYAMGARLANLLKGQMKTEMDQKAVAAAITDVFSGAEMRMTDREMKDAIIAHSQQEKQQKSEKAQANLDKGNAFLAENASKEGVVTLESGLQLKMITEGEGSAPAVTDVVSVHYKGTLVDGTEFDSSYKRGEPTSFPLNGVIPGFSEAIQQMKPGGKAIAYIPANLGYGERGAGGAIGPNEALIFEIELIEVKKPEQKEEG
ncbi:MAG: FKBP-type peptidyl-prolyl cis-trans isomerase [bacterium]